MFICGLGISFLYLAATAFFGIGFMNGRDSMFRLGGVAAYSSIPLHLGYLIMVGIRNKTIPLASFYQAMSVVSLFIALTYVIIRVSVHSKSVGFFVFPFVFTFHVIATFGPRIIYLGESFISSPLFWFHTLATLLGYAAFGFAMILSVMYLPLFREIKQNRPSRMYDRLPPLELLDRLNTMALVAGFVFLTVGMILGGALAVSVWKRIPFTDAKILASLVLWAVYLFGLLMLAVRKWRGRKLSLLSIIGFIVVIVGVVVARLFDSSFHRF